MKQIANNSSAGISVESFRGMVFGEIDEFIKMKLIAK